MDKVVELGAFVVGHLEVDGLSEVVREGVAECYAGMDMLDEAEGCYFEGFRLVVSNIDFVFKHVVHEFCILKF